MRQPLPLLVADTLPVKQRWIGGQAGAKDTQANLDNGPYAWFHIRPLYIVSVRARCAKVVGLHGASDNERLAI